MKKYGEKCTRCGECCKAIPCGIGLDLLGDHRPCLALELQGDEYTCGLVLYASKYVGLGQPQEELFAQVVSGILGIGMGCDRSPETDSIRTDMRRLMAGSSERRMMADRPDWYPTIQEMREYPGDDLIFLIVRKLVEWGEKPCTRHIVPSVGGRHPARHFDCPYCMQQLKQEVNDPHT